MAAKVWVDFSSPAGMVTPEWLVSWMQPVKNENAELSLGKPRAAASPRTPDAGANTVVVMERGEAAAQKLIVLGVSMTAPGRQRTAT